MNIPHEATDSNGRPADPARFLSNGWPAAWIAEDPDAEATSPRAVYQAMQAYVASGLSVIPITADEADKSPDARRVPSWKVFQVRRPQPDELRYWYELGGHFGLAVIAGAVSCGQKGCGLEIIDFDNGELGAQWVERVEARMPGLVARLVRVQSPRPGLHVYFRCPVFGQCVKLACAAAPATGGTQGPPKKVTLVEMKGEGGYALTVPSPRRCHPRNGLYRLVEGSPRLTEVPVITPEERAVLIEEARRFNRWTEPEASRVQRLARVVKSNGNRPGDDFERRMSWADILTPHGWVLVRRRGDIEDWRRPGKDHGISGTVNYGDFGLFYAFSTNAHPFEEGRGYNKFQAYAALNHNNDFVKAAQALRKEGYGEQGLAAGRRNGGQNVTTTVLALGTQASRR